MNVNPIELQKNLKGVNYPASKDDVVQAAEQNGAGDDIVEELRSATKDRFDSPADVMSALRD